MNADSNCSNSFTNFSDTSVWARDTPWASITINLQYLKPSTTYQESNAICSMDIDPSPLTPASTNSLFLPNIQDGEYPLLSILKSQRAKSIRGVDPQRERLQGGPRVQRDMSIKRNYLEIQRKLS